MPASNHDNDPSWVGFLKATIAGGLLFLLPLILVVLLFSHAMQIAGKVAHPISEFLTLGKVAGPAGEEGLAVLMLILISVAAGLLARTTPGRNLMRWSENSFLGGLPQYRLVKSLAEGLAQIENAEDLKPALVNIEDAWQIGYLLETLQKGWVAVFFRRPDTNFGQCDVLARRTGASVVNHDGGCHFDREAHGHRIRQGAPWGRSCASQNDLISEEGR